MSFTPEEDMELANLVSKYPCIFDLTNLHYKNYGARENAWSQISSDLNRSVDDCKKRWKNMKDTYNKNKRVRKLGTGSSAINKPTKWALADALSYLDEREGLSNIQSTDIEIDENYSNDEKEDTTNVEDIDMVPEIPSTSQSCSTDPMTQNYIFKSGKRKLSPKKLYRSKQRKNNDDLIALLKKSYSDERQIILNSITNDVEEDAIDTFFKSMALTVKTFSSNLKIKAKKEVFNIVTELEIENNNVSLKNAILKH